MKEFDGVEHMMEDVLAENHIYPTQQPQEAVSQQLNFLRRSLILLNLKDDFLV